MPAAKSPIKVPERTKNKVRYAASMSGIRQSELVELAVDEYVANHREEFEKRVKAASDALLGGNREAIAFALDVDPEAIDRIGGAKP